MHFKSLECSAVFGNKGGSTEMLNWSEIFHFYSRNWQLAWSTLLTTVARLLIFVYSTHSSEGDVFRGSYVRHFFSVLFVDLTVCVCSLMVVSSWQWSCKPVHGQEHSMFLYKPPSSLLVSFVKTTLKFCTEYLSAFALMTTGAFSRNVNVGKLFSELNLVTDNLLFICAEANWEATESCYC